MKKIIVLVLSLLFVTPAFAQDKPDTHEIHKGMTEAGMPAYLQSISVTIHSGRSQGSGVVKTRNGVNYIWTAAHVVAGLRETRQVIDKNGSVRNVVEFKDAQVVAELIEDGRSVGKLSMDAEVIRYSDADTGEDLALLRIRKKNFIRSSVRFYLDEKIPPVGCKLYHVGSLLGQVGSNSLTDGIMSQHGRVLYNKVYDQSTCAAFPGSSGGGVYLKEDGRYVGMIVRGAGETFNLMVPVRRMREWAKSVNVEFALDDSVPVPTDAELRKMPIESNGTHLSTSMPSASHVIVTESFPFLIGRTK